MITIPEKHYIGFRKQGHIHPLAFATPFGKDKAFEKRKHTVDMWSASGCYDWDPVNKKHVRKEVLPSKTMENTLLEGFEIAEHVRRSGSWNGGNVVWRVLDPRGFELEISSSNLASILGCATLVGGVIQGKCIWGREGAANVLLPEASEPYQDAVKATTRKNTKISLRDVQIGDNLTLKDGSNVCYLGSYKLKIKRKTQIRNPNYTYYSRESMWKDVLKEEEVKRYVFRKQNQKLGVVGSIHISAIVQKYPLPDVERIRASTKEEIKSSWKDKSYGYVDQWWPWGMTELEVV